MEMVENKDINEELINENGLGVMEINGQMNENLIDNLIVDVDLVQQMVVLNDKYLWLYLEFDNYCKWMNKEKFDLIVIVLVGVLKDLVLVMDDFEWVIVNNENLDDMEVLKEGFKLIYYKMCNLFENKGLK